MAAVTVPDLGDFTQVPVIELLVAVGDAVVKDQPLITLESDKATMEIPAPSAGVVTELLVKLGDMVSQGTAILTLDEAAGGAEALPAAAESATPHAAPPADAEAPQAAPSAAAAAAPATASGGDVHASPSVRRLARERGIDLATVTGSGRKGRVVPADLDRPAAAPATASGDRKSVV